MEFSTGHITLVIYMYVSNLTPGKVRDGMLIVTDCDRLAIKWSDLDCPSEGRGTIRQEHHETSVDCLSGRSKVV